MAFTPTPDYGSDLWTGDRIDLANPPKHCGAAMRVSSEPPFGHRLDCHEDDYEIHTNESGVLTEPPHTTRD